MTRVERPCPAVLDRESGAELLKQIRLHGVGMGEVLVLDFSKTNRMDSLGAAWLLSVADYLRARGGGLDEPERVDERRRQRTTGDREVLHRALGLRPPQGRGRHLHLAEAVLLGTELHHVILS